jgi:signal transduction histidine kinase
VYDHTNHTFIRPDRYFHQAAIPSLEGIRIYQIIQAQDGTIWIGAQNGLHSVNLRTGSREVITTESPGEVRLSSNLVYCLLATRDGMIWIGTLNGLDVFNPLTRRMHHFTHEPGNPNSLCDNFVTALCEDHTGMIWIGTNSFLNRFSRGDSVFTYYAKESGFPSNLVYEIVEDNRLNLWFATGGGLCRIDRTTGKFRTYTVEEGLQSMEFNLRAACKSNDGEIFFGGMNGFNSFYPDSLTDNPFLPQVVLTSAYKMTKAEKERLDIDNAEEIVLRYDDYNFTIEFAALEFTNPAKNRYAYQMTGISDEWVETGNRRFVTFSKLPPGEYFFSVTASNNDGVWNRTGCGIRIIIKPPWWRTTWAWAAWFLLLAGGIMVYVRIREKSLLRERDLLEQKVNRRTLLIEEQKARILETNDQLSQLNQELKALNTTKDKFFSIIAHDLRNPFNTILGLCEVILGKAGDNCPPAVLKSVTDIRDASRHAFDLLQNLLIWARSQTGNLEFQPEAFDLDEHIQENLGLVKSQAGKKSIRLEYNSDGPVPVFGDTRMIDTILRNLLTNAIKFTPQKGNVRITVFVDGNHTGVAVEDNGIGIPADNLARIFKPDGMFTRKGTEKERGSGLGLMLCHEFIQKHNGSIQVESEPGKGSRFTVLIPARDPQ